MNRLLASSTLGGVAMLKASLEYPRLWPSQLSQSHIKFHDLDVRVQLPWWTLVHGKKKVYLHGTIEHADAVMICVTYALLPLQTIKKCCPRTMYFGYHSHENAQPSQHLGFLVVHFFDFTLVVWRSRCCPWHIQWSKWWWIIGTRGTRRSKPLVVFLLSFVARDWSAHRLIQLYLSIRTLLLTH
jgi:hypothetical protein